MLQDEAKLHIAFFFANFHEPSRPDGQMDQVVTKLAEVHPNVLFAKIDAEEVSDAAEQFDVAVVPSMVFLKDRTFIDKLEGADPAELARRIDRWLKATSAENPVPVAQAADGSTPLGGVPSSLSGLEERLKSLIHSAPVMIFMKGTPSAPRCKFSRQLVELLQQAGIARYGAFDILGSDEVRQGLKAYSDWPTFPQVYVNGALLGGLDILRELHEAGELVKQIPQENLLPPKTTIAPAATAATAPATLEDRLRALVNRSPCMVFIKGTPDDPICGFSERMVSILRQHKVTFDSFDILKDNEVREGLKRMFDWPTYPQLYVRGELVGGIDVVKQMLEEAPEVPLTEQLGL